MLYKMWYCEYNKLYCVENIIYYFWGNWGKKFTYWNKFKKVFLYNNKLFCANGWIYYFNLVYFFVADTANKKKTKHLEIIVLEFF